jgi:predicted enzyme related to lactoylglutathione lyase
MTDNFSITCYFAVDNLNATLSQLEKEGGVVVCEPFTLTIAPEVFDEYEAKLKANTDLYGTKVERDIGRSAIIQDPDGNYLGLTELRPQAYFLFEYGPKYPTQIGKDQLAEHQKGIDLGKKLTPLS